MKGRRILMSGLALGLLMALAVGLGQAQGLEPDNELPPEGTDSLVNVEDTVTSDIPIQGRLTDAAGNPVPDGTYSITFRLYDAEVGGTLLCEDTDNLPVANGLFTALMGYCTLGDINGQELWLGIRVEGDEEMVPRQRIGPVPYARSLRPGAEIVGSRSSGILEVENLDGGTLSSAVMGKSSGYGGGVVGVSSNGTGVWGLSIGGYAGYFSGEVGQSRTADGLVKAAVHAFCDEAGSTIYRSFNNVNSTSIAIFNGSNDGACVIDFGFRINDRYFVATAPSGGSPRGVSCFWGGDEENLECRAWDTAGNGASGTVMVLVY